jgi:hypothetical protein
MFHVKHNGRLFVNPGSCGCAKDCDPAAAYTLMEYKDNGWFVEERRVVYDIDTVISDLYKSDIGNNYLNRWGKVIAQSLITGKQCFKQYLAHIEEVGRKHGYDCFPLGDDVWKIGAETWMN